MLYIRQEAGAGLAFYLRKSPAPLTDTALQCDAGWSGHNMPCFSDGQPQGAQAVLLPSLLCASTCGVSLHVDPASNASLHIASAWQYPVALIRLMCCGSGWDSVTAQISRQVPFCLVLSCHRLQAHPCFVPLKGRSVAAQQQSWVRSAAGTVPALDGGFVLHAFPPCCSNGGSSSERASCCCNGG